MTPDNSAVTILLPTPHQQQFAMVCSLLFLAFVVFLVRRRTIREEYALLWLATGVAVLALSLSRTLLLLLVRISGAGLASSVLLLAAIFFVFLVLMHLTAVASRQRRMIRDLAIHAALLEREIAVLRDKLGSGGERRGNAD